MGWGAAKLEEAAQRLRVPLNVVADFWTRPISW